MCRRMQAGLLEPHETEIAVPTVEDLATDPRWLLIVRISSSEGLQKSSRLPALLQYLARCTLLGDRRGLTEQSIGRAVLNKREDYTPTEDSSVRVYVRQLRIRLKDYYQAEGAHEQLRVDLPKGGYTLVFTPVESREHVPIEPLPQPVAVPAVRKTRPAWNWLVVSLAAALAVCAGGWIHAVHRQEAQAIPWPLSTVLKQGEQTTMVLADASYSLRLLNDQAVPLDQYIDHSYLKKAMPEHMDRGEARLIHYLAASQLTSMADVTAASNISALNATGEHNLVIRSARDLSPSDLNRGNFIFVGARTSNPWVELFDEPLNFHIGEDLAQGTRLIQNRHPLPGEQPTYAVPDSTGMSGEDYAVIAMLPNRSGQGSVLLLEGLRREGTEAAIHLLQNDSLLAALQHTLANANHGTIPTHFEALLHARSIAGAPVSVDFVAVRPGRD